VERSRTGSSRSLRGLGAAGVVMLAFAVFVGAASALLVGHSLSGGGAPETKVERVVKPTSQTGVQPRPKVHQRTSHVSGAPTAQQVKPPTVKHHKSSRASGVQSGTPGASQSGAFGTAAANAYIRSLPNANQVSYAVYSRSGRPLASENAGFSNYSASITKSILLAAYLQMYPQTPTGAAATYLSDMIQESDNASANWVYSSLAKQPTTTASYFPAATQAAMAVGVAGFSADQASNDGTYSLGRSYVTAPGMAKYFATIQRYVPEYGLELLHTLSPEDQWGVFDARINVKYSKAGWGIPGPSGGIVVNQAATVVTAHHGTVGIAVLSSGNADVGAGESVMENVAHDLLAGR
jgi:hypothetical protein